MKALHYWVVAGWLAMLLIACTPTPISPTATATLSEALVEPSATPEPATATPTNTPTATPTPLPETATAQTLTQGCALLGREEVEAAIGPLQFDPIPSHSVGSSDTGTFWNCRYDGANGYLFVSRGPEGGISAREYFDKFLAGATDVQMIDDLGEAAFWDPRDKAPGELYDGTLLVLKGDVVLLLYVGAENARDIAIQLAEVALNRVP